MKQRLSRTPVLRRGTYTADYVLDFVANTIEAEPMRLFMKSWVSCFKGERIGGWKVRKPECGTVACAAGWIGIATRREQHVRGAFAAFNILGIYRLRHESLYEELYDLFMDTSRRRPDVLKRLREITERHRATLQELEVVVE